MEYNISIRVISVKANNNFLKNYSYIVHDDISNTAIVIDPSWQMKEIEKKLSKLEMKLSAILLTHSHIDHVFDAEKLSNKYNAPIVMSQIEYEYYKFDSNNLITVKHEEIINFENIVIVSLITPGHTKGSICYLIDNNLFTGDTLFIEGCGICWGKGADPSDMFDTMQYLKTRIDKNVLIYPGHSYGKEPGEIFESVCKENVYLNFTDRNNFLSFRMRKGQIKLFDFK
jgi:hydroxyacylglutathione hydrolase